MTDYYMPEDDVISLLGCSKRVLDTACDQGVIKSVISVFTGSRVYREQDVNRLRRLMNYELAESVKRGHRV